MKTPTKKAASQARPQSRRPYQKPRLVAYGSVAKLTQGGAGSLTDGGMANMTCL